MAMYFLLQKVQDFLTRNLKTNVTNDCTSGVFLLCFYSLYKGAENRIVIFYNNYTTLSYFIHATLLIYLF